MLLLLARPVGRPLAGPAARPRTNPGQPLVGDGATRYGDGHRLYAAGSPSANTGIAAVKANCHPNRFKKFFAANQYGFNQVAANGEIIGRSEKYTTAASTGHAHAHPGLATNGNPPWMGGRYGCHFCNASASSSWLRRVFS